MNASAQDGAVAQRWIVFSKTFSEVFGGTVSTCFLEAPIVVHCERCVIAKTLFLVNRNLLRGISYA
jgi:hypothetical protein